jgi:hypothetical protein
MKHLDCIGTNACKSSTQTMEPNMTEDLTTDEDLTETKTTTIQSKSEIVRPEYLFQGKPMWPYTLGAQIVYSTRPLSPRTK